MIYLRDIKKVKEDINSLRKRTREELKKDIEDLNKKKDLFFKRGK